MNIMVVSWLVALGFGAREVAPEELTPALAGESVIVRGVYGGMVGAEDRRMLRLRHCEARFLVHRLTIPSYKPKTNLEIEGTVRTEGTMVLVDMTRCRELPSDIEEFHRRSSALDPNDYESWYALAAWARGRIEKYDSPGLAPNAVQAYRKGIAAERKQAAGDATKLERLIERVRADHRDPDVDLVDLVHELVRARLAKVKPDRLALRGFAQTVHELLVRDAPQKIPPLELETRRRYEADPLVTFRSRGDAGRKQLARYLEVTILERAWQLDFDLDRSDPLSVARTVLEEAPDYPDLAHQWTEKGLSALRKDLDHLSANRVEEHAKCLEEKLREPKAARQLRLDWLGRQQENLWSAEETARAKAKQEGRLPPPGDAQTRVDLANLYERWFPGDAAVRDRVVGLLTEAARMDPSLEVAKRKLAALGRPEMAKPNSAPADEPAITKSNDAHAPLRPGMTAEEVRKVHGEPDSRAKVVTRAGIRHQWSYRGIKQTTLVELAAGRDGTMRVAAIRVAQ